MEAAKLLKRRPWGMAGAILLLLMIVVAIFAPLLAPYHPNEIQVQHRLEAPSSTFLLGTDNLGRDILSRVLWGSQIYLRMGLIAVGAAAVLGLLFGFLSTYLRGKTDYILQRALLIPVLFLGAIVLLFFVVGTPANFLLTPSAIIGPQFATTFIPLLLVAVFLPSSYNVVRRGAEALKHSQTPLHHLLRMLASMAVVALVNLGIAVGMAVLAIVPLSYRGFGVPPPEPCWGSMLSGAGRQYMLLAPWTVIFPGTAIALASLGLILFGHAVRDIWVPHPPEPVSGTEHVNGSPATAVVDARADFWTRWMACLIDLVILQIVTQPLWLLAPSQEMYVVGRVVALVVYLLFFWSLFSATPGKMVLGLKIVSADGQRLTVWKALVRVLGYLASALPLGIGFIMVAFDLNKRGFHDRIAGTYVMRR